MRKVLIIDDDEQVGLLFSRILADGGFTIQRAPNGRIAKTIYDNDAPDLVITDILMPEMDGIEVIRDLHKTHPHVKVLAISGGSRMGHLNFLEMAKSLGADRILHKPVSPQELLQEVRQLLAED